MLQQRETIGAETGQMIRLDHSSTKGEDVHLRASRRGLRGQRIMQKQTEDAAHFES